MTYAPHLIIITETWLYRGISEDEIVPPGYKTHRKDSNGRGGGVAIINLDSLTVTRLPDIPGVEYVIIKVQFDDHSTIVGGLYRPSNSDNTFCEKFNEFLRICKTDQSNVMLCDDFNFPSIDWNNGVPDARSTTAEPFIYLFIYLFIYKYLTGPW